MIFASWTLKSSVFSLQAVTGMAGIGKTRLAQAYADEATQRQLYRSGVHWLNASNDSTILSGLREMVVSRRNALFGAWCTVRNCVIVAMGSLGLAQGRMELLENICINVDISVLARWSANFTKTVPATIRIT